MAHGFVKAIKCKLLSHGTDAMKHRCWGDVVKATKFGPHLHVYMDSAIGSVKMARVFYFKEEDGLILHSDNIGNNLEGASFKSTMDSQGKEIKRMDDKRTSSEAHPTENLVEDPEVVIFEGSVMWDVSKFVKYMLRQHVGCCV